MGKVTILFLTLLASLGLQAEPCRSEQLIVDEPLAGLYESIPNQSSVLMGRQYHVRSFEAEYKAEFSYDSEIFDSFGKKRGFASSEFNADGTEMVLVSTDLRYFNSKFDPVDSMITIPKVKPLVKGRGVPTLLLLRLHQMRLHGVKYGGLKRLDGIGVVNVRTALQLRFHPLMKDWFRENPLQFPPHELVEKAILDTNTGRYMQSLALQSGHRITRIYIGRGSMEIQRNIVRSYHKEDPLLAPLLQQSSDLIYLPYNFDVSFDLEPYQVQKLDQAS